jgi:uncharacterized protein YukE
VSAVSWNGDSAVDRLRLQVNPENVLRVRATLLAESDRLSAAIERGGQGDWVGFCGGDPLSADARAAFNERIDDVAGQCRAYADSLRAAGDSLEQVARDYGHTDAAIAASYQRMSWAAQGGSA